MSLHPLRHFLRDGIGFSTLVAAIALTWPGVEIARADDQSVLMSVDPALVDAQAVKPQAARPAPTKEVASCSNPGTPSTLGDAMLTHQIRRMMREYAQRAEAGGHPDPSQGIVLNGNGYNYAPTRLNDQP